MEVAQNVSTGQLAKKVGRTIEVLVDDVQPDEGRAIARSKWDAPDIDGQVIVDNAAGIKPGDKVTVTVTGSDEYDLFAVPVGAVEATGSATARNGLPGHEGRDARSLTLEARREPHSPSRHRMAGNRTGRLRSSDFGPSLPPPAGRAASEHAGRLAALHAVAGSSRPESPVTSPP